MIPVQALENYIYVDVGTGEEGGGDYDESSIPHFQFDSDATDL